MDQAILWLVLWAVFMVVGPSLVYLAGLVAGIGLSEVTDQEGWAVIGGLFGWLGGVAWFIFAAVKVIEQIISVVQLASG